MDHNMRKNSYKIVLSHTRRTEGGNFLPGTGRGKVDVPSASWWMYHWARSKLGQVLTGHVIGRRRDLTGWQRLEGSDWVFFSTTSSPSTAGTFSGPSGNTKSQKADLCLQSAEMFIGAAITTAANDAAQRTCQGFDGWAPLFLCVGL